MANKQNAVQGNEKIVALLNRIMEYELAGVVRYTHY
jgi:bacterioferritin (cytochrome b1)